jgi:hypothetical protein
VAAACVRADIDRSEQLPIAGTNESRNSRESIRNG